VNDSTWDRGTHSRVGSGSPIWEDGLQQNDSGIGTDMDTVQDVDKGEDVSPLQPPRKRRKPTPAKRKSKAQLRRQDCRHISLTPSIEDSARCSYVPSDEGFFKRIIIGGQKSYTLEFALVHKSLSVASPLQSNLDKPITTPARANRPRPRTHRSYEVERVVNKEVSPAGDIRYLVRWKGYGPESDEWKPSSAMAKAKDLVED
jgi:hypothetical protein